MNLSSHSFKYASLWRIVTLLLLGLCFFSLQSQALPQGRKTTYGSDVTCGTTLLGARLENLDEKFSLPGFGSSILEKYEYVGPFRERTFKIIFGDGKMALWRPYANKGESGKLTRAKAAGALFAFEIGKQLASSVLVPVRELVIGEELGLMTAWSPFLERTYARARARSARSTLQKDKRDLELIRFIAGLSGDRNMEGCLSIPGRKALCFDYGNGFDRLMLMGEGNSEFWIQVTDGPLVTDLNRMLYPSDFPKGGFLQRSIFEIDREELNQFLSRKPLLSFKDERVDVMLLGRHQRDFRRILRNYQEGDVLQFVAWAGHIWQRVIRSEWSGLVSDGQRAQELYELSEFIISRPSLFPQEFRDSFRFWSSIRANRLWDQVTSEEN